MPEQQVSSNNIETEVKKAPVMVDFASIAAMFDDDEQPAPVCDLENPESCESCQ